MNEGMKVRRCCRCRVQPPNFLFSNSPSRSHRRGMLCILLLFSLIDYCCPSEAKSCKFLCLENYMFFYKKKKNLEVEFCLFRSFILKGSSIYLLGRRWKFVGAQNAGFSSAKGCAVVESYFGWAKQKQFLFFLNKLFHSHTLVEEETFVDLDSCLWFCALWIWSLKLYEFMLFYPIVDLSG